MTSNTANQAAASAGTYSIPVEQMDFSPNISSEAENFFQSDADLARTAARQGMVNYDKGQAIKIASKVLDMCLGIHKAAPALSSTTTEASTASIGDANTDKALVGTTVYLAESGHIARKLNLEVSLVVLRLLCMYVRNTGKLTTHYHRFTACVLTGCRPEKR